MHPQKAVKLFTWCQLLQTFSSALLPQTAPLASLQPHLPCHQPSSHANHYCLSVWSAVCLRSPPAPFLRAYAEYLKCAWISYHLYFIISWSSWDLWGIVPCLRGLSAPCYPDSACAGPGSWCAAGGGRRCCNHAVKWLVSDYYYYYYFVNDFCHFITTSKFKERWSLRDMANICSFYFFHWYRNWG